MLVLLAALALLRARSAAASERASAPEPLPLVKQELGYQFYAALPIEADLHALLVEYYEHLAEVDGGRKPSATASHALFDTLARHNFDAARTMAAQRCAERTEWLRDPCTTARFSPFELVCELTIVVDAKCHAARKRTLLTNYDDDLRDALDVSVGDLGDALCGASDCESRSPEPADLPPPAQAYDEFARRRSTMRSAARRLSRRAHRQRAQ